MRCGGGSNVATDNDRFHQEFLQEVQRAADADGKFFEDAFFETFCNYVVDAGDIDEANRAYFNNGRGMRVDGYGGQPLEQDGVLTIIAADVNQDEDVETLTATELDAVFKRATSFVSRSLDRTFRNGLEESSPGFGLADMIASSWAGVAKVRILLVTNRVLSKRIDGKGEGTLDGKPVVYSVWDLTRLRQFAESGRAREEMVVDLAESGGYLPALPAHLGGAAYEAYLIVMPAAQLARIYDRWGARLLEQNVRVFLQARGSVNKGIRNTLEREPEMFFAYNNGLAATAEEVTTRTSADGMRITRLRNLQIVNGGQTTASIYAASRRQDLSLDRTFVQVKLSVIPPERAEEVVPNISQFANSQNRVNAADFFANHPFHLRMKKFSEVTYALAPDGSFRQSKWFYERARGQYLDARSGLSASEQKRFDLEYPREQVFTKTDLAKFVNVWEGKPEVVSKGAQKNFAEFAGYVGKRWETNGDEYNERFYTTVVAKAICFKAAERIVSAQPWYEGGYRANIVAYALAKIGYDAGVHGLSPDFDRIWKRQGVSEAMELAIVRAAEAARDVVQNPPEGGVKNVTEWAKHQRCWELMKSKAVDWPKAWLNELASVSEQAAEARSARRQQKVLDGIEAQTTVVNAGAPFWAQVKAWAESKKLLGQKDLEILDVACHMPAKLPSEKQCAVIMAAYNRLRQDGLPMAILRR